MQPAARKRGKKREPVTIVFDLRLIGETDNIMALI